MVFSTHIVNFECGIGPIEMKLKQMEPQYIKDIGNWNHTIKMSAIRISHLSIL